MKDDNWNKGHHTQHGHQTGKSKQKHANPRRKRESWQCQNTIASNRNQFKIIGYNGFSQKNIDSYKEETNAFLNEQGSSGAVVSIEHNTADTSKGDMEMFVVTVTNPNDRDLILGLVEGTIDLCTPQLLREVLTPTSGGEDHHKWDN
jgi:hypothetical protein